MISIRSMLPIPKVQSAFNEHGVPSDPMTDEYSAQFFDEFMWYMRALREARKGGVPY